VIVTVAPDANGDVGAHVVDAAKTAHVALIDGLRVKSAEDVARQLSPIFEVDSSSDFLTAAIQPGRHLEALGLGAPGARAVEERWQHAPPLASEVLVGRTESGNLVLNLARDVHWMVAGMTGSGKSELLRTLVAGLAAGQPPERLAFLFIDFKGNSAFRECERLPHSVGLLSNLDDHLAIRVLDAISIELTRRQRDLDAAGFGSADEAWTAAWHAGDAPLFPRLVVVVDELKELTDAYPEAAHRLNQVARIGRSLGVHLLLATQKPSRVAGFDELRSQVDVRICLRVADSADSHDVIGAPDAALISRSTPGSGFLRNADARLVSFQGGNLSNPYVACQATDGVTVRPFDLAHLGEPPSRRPPPASAPHQSRSDLDVLVDAIGAAAASRGTCERRRPWLPPLPTELSLDDPVIAHRRVSGPLAAPIGLLDRLSEARQEPMVVDLEGVGNLLVVGGPGSGRTTLLETVVASLTRRVPPEALHCYGIEGRRHSLKWLAAVEHCGAVVGLDDPEHLERLTGFLVGELRRRAQLGAAWRGSEPHILLLCDAFEALADHAALDDLSQQMGRLSGLVNEGPAHGLHVVITTDSRGATARWLSSIDTRIVLRPNRRDDQLALGLPHRPGAPDMNPGRGYLLPGPVEVQIARGHYQHTAVRVRPTIALSRRARLPVRVEPMPSTIGALEAEARRGQARPAGPVITPVVGGVEMGPLDVDMADGGTFVIGGPRRSGRSTALLACLASLRLPSGTPDVVVIAPRRSPLRAWAGAENGGAR
jgi:S-DNA-T family DNA segregation ATPase FtsK/SpoIIIE